MSCYFVSLQPENNQHIYATTLTLCQFIFYNKLETSPLISVALRKEHPQQ